MERVRVILSGSALRGRTNEMVSVLPRLAFEQKPNHGQRQLAGRLFADGFNDVAVSEVLFVGGRAGHHADHGGVSKTFGNQNSHLGGAGGTVLVDFVFGRGQVAGIGVERFEQTVERSGGYVVHIGFGDVIGLDSPQHVAVDAHLAVSAILCAAGMNAQQAELAQAKAKAKGDQDRNGNH